MYETEKANAQANYVNETKLQGVGAAVKRDDCADMQPMQAAGMNPHYRPSVRAQLEKSAYGMIDQHTRTARALEIITRHPEFEEFLELQDLLKNDRLYR